MLVPDTMSARARLRPFAKQEMKNEKNLEKIVDRRFNRNLCVYWRRNSICLVSRNSSIFIAFYVQVQAPSDCARCNTDPNLIDGFKLQLNRRTDASPPSNDKCGLVVGAGLAYLRVCDSVTV